MRSGAHEGLLLCLYDAGSCQFFGMRLIFILVREYGVHYLIKIEIVDLESIQSKEEEGEKKVGESLALRFVVPEGYDIQKKWLITRHRRCTHDACNAILGNFLMACVFMFFFFFRCIFIITYFCTRRRVLRC